MGSGRFPEETLQRNLFKDYIRTARPFTNDSFTTHVNFHLSLVKVIHIDEFSGSLEGEFHMWTNWHDDRLTWNSDDFGELNYISVPTTAIWTPNIVLSNSAENVYSHSVAEMAVVTSTGNISISRTSKLKSACDLDLTHFPKDTQECRLTFASQTYDVQSLTISTQYEDDTNASTVSNSTPWSVMGVAYERETTQQDFRREYDQVTYTVKVKRNCPYCKHLYVTPVALLGLLVPFQFLLPMNARERSCFVSAPPLVYYGRGMYCPGRTRVPAIRSVEKETGFISEEDTSPVTCCPSQVLSAPLETSTSMFWRQDWPSGWAPCTDAVFIDVIGSLMCADAPKIPLGVTSDAPITEVTDADTKNAGLEHQLEAVLGIMHSMQINSKRLRAERLCLDEWRIVSLVLDRLLFVVFLVIYFITSLEFLG
ncbi:neuronal acetylcholine receptor subunit non-alpha-3-like [Gigantopelta aegis]|uniref:neuronal acetylcholine receptor subunit non-alpha-3-like n=1 Tax=Gigantopelta aegis TaxID=1735272 RepID=UPI001B888B2A|nr:neuronal acetylcholine receptor subunit non-alpha-3-like [Gigantopelta aegis]